jgi:hypothetical protein
MSKLENAPENLALIRNAIKMILISGKIGITPNLWQAQNIAFKIKRKIREPEIPEFSILLSLLQIEK